VNSLVRRPPPPLAPDPFFAFPRVARARLANGLGVWSIERRRLPLVTVTLVVPAGSSIDPARAPGLASLTADMLDEGSSGLSAIGIQEAFGRLGTSLEIDVGADAVLVSLAVLPEHLRAACDLLFDCVGRPTLANADFERIRTLRLNRLRPLRQSPGALADHAFAQSVFGTHPYGHPPYGVSGALERMTIDDVVRLHAAAWRPDRATLVLAGAIGAGEAAGVADAASGRWAAARPPAVDGAAGPEAGAAPEPARPAAPRIVLVDRPGAAQTELRVGHASVARRTPDYHALVLLNAVLGGQFVSRINLNLRERRAYTYGAYTSFDFRRQAGAFALQTSVQTDATADAVAESIAEIRAIGSDRPPTADEMAFCRASVTRGYARHFESTSQIARALTVLAVHGLPDDTFDRFVPAIRSLGTGDLAAAAAAHLHPAALTVVAVGDRARIEDGLASLGLGAPEVINVEV